ncbi:hypothetical protein L9F63_015844, partial [Diploptera punctata]
MFELDGDFDLDENFLEEVFQPENEVSKKKGGAAKHSSPVDPVQSSKKHRLSEDNDSEIKNCKESGKEDLLSEIESKTLRDLACFESSNVLKMTPEMFPSDERRENVCQRIITREMAPVINTPNRTPLRQRKFPGPAGLLPEKDEMVNRSVLPTFTTTGGSDELLLCSQSSNSVFESALWLQVLSDFVHQTPVSHCEIPQVKYMVGVLSTGLSARRHYLNITSNNILNIYCSGNEGDIKNTTACFTHNETICYVYTICSSGYSTTKNSPRVCGFTPKVPRFGNSSGSQMSVSSPVASSSVLNCKNTPNNSRTCSTTVQNSNENCTTPILNSRNSCATSRSPVQYSSMSMEIRNYCWKGNYSNYNNGIKQQCRTYIISQNGVEYATANYNCCMGNKPPLVKAVFMGNVEEVRLLLGQKEDVNYQDPEKRSPLHAAAFRGNSLIVEALILNGARVNTKDSKWLTPLHRACCSGSEETVEILLKHKADINARDRNWQTPLHVAAANNAVQCAENLIPLLPNINVTDRGGRTSLHHAAYNGNHDMAELLLSHGCVVNACDKKDRRPLHWAAHMGYEDVVRLLLNHAADLNVKDKDLYTPLHAAAASGNVNVAQILLESGAEVDAKNSYGNTPLHIACLNGHANVCSELHYYGADINALNYRGQTPLHIAAASTHGVGCLEVLIKVGADINLQSEDGRTPLHMTAIHGRFTRSKTLIDNGAIVDSMDKDGCTALHIAALYGHELLSGTLLSFRADPNKRGRTPLHMCCLGGYVECCRKFLQAGVDLDAQDNTGKTPLHLAGFFVIYCSVDCLDLLVSSGANFQLQDAQYRIPLHYAAAQGQYPCVYALVGIGSQVNKQDVDGCTPLHQAAAQDVDGKCVEYLLQHKADPRIRDNQGYTAIHYAVAGGNQTGLEFLLAAVGSYFNLSGENMPKMTPLHLAAYHGHGDILRLLLPLFSNANIKDDTGKTPLDLASFKGHRLCVQLLLRCGGLVSVHDAVTQRTPVHAAVLNGHKECLLLLLENTEESQVVDSVDYKKRTPLMLAVAAGHSECVIILLKYGANTNLVDEDQHPALFRAVVHGHQESVELLVGQGASPTFQDRDGKSALHLAAACGHLSCLVTLLGNTNEDVGLLQDSQGCTVLHWSCYNGNANCVEYLLEQKHVRSMEGNPFSPVHCAVFQGSEHCLELLITHFGPSIVNLRDHRGRTPLHVAAFHNNVECMQLLLNQNASVEARDATGKTPLLLAAYSGQCNAIELLLDWKANIKACDLQSNTALHHACQRKHSRSAMLLLSRTDDPEVVNMANKELRTPLHLSSRHGMVAVTRLLLEKGANVLAVDCNGMTPALACAPDPDVAECLAIILSMYPSVTLLAQQPNNFQKDHLQSE